MLLLLDKFKEKLLQEGRSPATIYSMERNIVYFSKFLGHDNMKKVSREDIKRYKVYSMTEYPNGKSKGLSVGTVVNRLYALDRYFKYLLQSREIFFDPTLNIEVPKEEKHFPEYIPTEKDIEELLRQPDTNTTLGIRDRTLFELMYTCPLRNIEVRRLSIHEVDMKKKYIYPERAKGGRECGIPIASSTYKILEKYLEIARPRLAMRSKKPTDNFFLTEHGRPFEYGAIHEILQRYRGSKRIHAHLLRHACAVHMLRHGAGIRDIQVLLGHRHIRSTQSYTKLAAGDIKDLQEKYHPRERRHKHDSANKRV